MIVEYFQKVVGEFGMNGLKHPLFYHAPIAIRFEIGGEEPVYLETGATNPTYISGALTRALAIYEALPEKPHLLRIDGYRDEETIEELTKTICRHTGLPTPHETRTEIVEEEAGQYERLELYWNLSQIAFEPEILLREIIRSDIGGWSGFASNVFFLADGPVLYHLYDDRGLDVLGGTRETLLPLYERFSDWILEYDRAQIDAVFAGVSE